MALTGQNTPYFDLYKPALTDSPPDITSTNPNWDKIDNALRRLDVNGLPAHINAKLPSMIATTEIKEVYLSPNGDDTADGTAENPLKTISTAISRFGGTSRLTLRFNAGTYEEINAIEVAGCTSVELYAVTPGTVTLNLSYTQCGGYFTMQNISVVSSPTETRYSFTFYGVKTYIGNCTFNVKAAALVFRNGSSGTVLDTSFTNCANSIYAMGGSVVNAQGISGSGNTYAYYSAGGIIFVGASTITATTLAMKSAGGVIFRGGNLFGTTANTFVNAT